MTQNLNLTTIAALPGSGAGHVAALRPECSRPRYQEPVRQIDDLLESRPKFSERMGIVDGKLPSEVKARFDVGSFKTPELRGQFLACAHQHNPASWALPLEARKCQACGCLFAVNMGAPAMHCQICGARPFKTHDVTDPGVCHPPGIYDPADPPGAVPGSADNPLGLRSVADMQAQRGGA